MPTPADPPFLRKERSRRGAGTWDTASAPRALRDIQAGQAAGQFGVADAEIALSAVAGGLIGLLQLHQRHPERVQQTSVDDLAEACLRLLGLPAARAKKVARLPLPATDTW
jgi:hypothetical protein